MRFVLVGVGNLGMVGDERFYFLDGGESGGGTDGPAVEASSCGCKEEAFGDRFAVIESVEESGPEGISGAGGINYSRGREGRIVASGKICASSDETVGSVA